MPDAAGKQLILVTALPNGKRLATLRRVERVEGGQVVLQTDREDRQDTLPARDCIEVKGGDRIVEKTLGLGVREVSIGDLTTGEEDGSASDAAHSVLDAFGVEPGAPVYVIRGGDKRGELHDALRKALGPDPIIVSCPPGHCIEHLDRQQMRACGWVRADEVQKQRDDAPAEAAS